MGTEDNREFAEVQYTLETMGRNYFVKVFCVISYLMDNNSYTDCRGSYSIILDHFT
jgi:hypothetical protein